MARFLADPNIQERPMPKGWHFATDVEADPLFTKKAGFVVEKNCWKATEVQWNLTEFSNRIEFRSEAATPIEKSGGLMLRCKFQGGKKGAQPDEMIVELVHPQSLPFNGRMTMNVVTVNPRNKDDVKRQPPMTSTAHRHTFKMNTVMSFITDDALRLEIWVMLPTDLAESKENEPPLPLMAQNLRKTPRKEPLAEKRTASDKGRMPPPSKPLEKQKSQKEKETEMLDKMQTPRAAVAYQQALAKNKRDEVPMMSKAEREEKRRREEEEKRLKEEAERERRERRQKQPENDSDVVRKGSVADVLGVFDKAKVAKVVTSASKKQEKSKKAEKKKQEPPTKKEEKKPSWFSKKKEQKPAPETKEVENRGKSEAKSEEELEQISASVIAKKFGAVTPRVDRLQSQKSLKTLPKPAESAKIQTAPRLEEPAPQDERGRPKSTTWQPWAPGPLPYTSNSNKQKMVPASQLQQQAPPPRVKQFVQAKPLSPVEDIRMSPTITPEQLGVTPGRATKLSFTPTETPCTFGGQTPCERDSAPEPKSLADKFDAMADVVSRISLSNSKHTPSPGVRRMSSVPAMGYVRQTNSMTTPPDRLPVRRLSQPPNRLPIRPSESMRRLSSQSASAGRLSLPPNRLPVRQSMPPPRIMPPQRIPSLRRMSVPHLHFTAPVAASPRQTIKVETRQVSTTRVEIRTARSIVGTAPPPPAPPPSPLRMQDAPSGDPLAQRRSLPSSARPLQDLDLKANYARHWQPVSSAQLPGARTSGSSVRPITVRRYHSMGNVSEIRARFEATDRV